jgi:hypothetical protein
MSPCALSLPGACPGDSGEEALPTSIGELYAHSDPAQAIIDLMGYATKPDYLWLGNASDGPWVDVESGLSLAKTGTPLFEQPEAAFGGADSVEFDQNGDGFNDASADAALNGGADPFQIISIYNLNVKATAYGAYKYDTKGWRHYALSNGYQYWNLNGGSGAITASINADHGVANPQVLLETRDGTTARISSREGSGSVGDTAGTIQTVGSQGLRFGFGLFAIWMGSGDLTTAQRLLLAQGLGLE